MKTIERFTESMRSIFEEQDDQSHKDTRIWPFILWIVPWMFISVVIGVFGWALLFNDCLYNELTCDFVITAILFKTMGKLYVKANKVI